MVRPPERRLENRRRICGGRFAHSRSDIRARNRRSPSCASRCSSLSSLPAVSGLGYGSGAAAGMTWLRLFGLTAWQNVHDPCAKPNKPCDLRSRHREHLGIPSLQRLDEIEHVFKPLARVRMNFDIGVGGRQAEFERRNGGVDLTFLAACCDANEHLPDVCLSLEMFAPIPPDRHPPDQVP